MGADFNEKYNLRKIDVPCCGNCRYFEREYEDTFCSNRKINSCSPMEHFVCDLFEKRGKGGEAREAEV